MAKQWTALNKKVAPLGSSKKQKEKKKTPTKGETSTLHAALQAKEDGKKAHLRAPRTTENYSSHVRQGHKWLQHNLEGHLTAEGTALEETSSSHSVEDFYKDPLSKDAFEHIPNERSNEVLSLYLAWRGFQENMSQSTVEGIQAAFKCHWDSV